MRAALSAAALAALLSIAPASAGRFSEFELNKLSDWTEAIAVCDVTRFLLTEPNINADVILTSGRGNAHVALHHPLYTPPTNFYSEPMREAYEILHKTGLVTAEGYSRARVHYARRMIEAYRNASSADKRALLEQLDLCYRLAARVGVKRTSQERLAFQ